MATGQSHSRRKRPRNDARIAPEANADAPDRCVRVTCPACGVVRVRVNEVVLRNCVDDNSWSYRARCSRCGTLFVAATPPALALPAVTAGVSVEQWSMPVPSARHSAGPIRETDAMALHVALMKPDWFDELLRELPPEQ